LARGDQDEAIKQANAALKARPGDDTAMRLLAQAQKAQRDRANHDRALALARDAIAAGNYSRAVELLNLVLQGWPEDPAAKDLLAQAQRARPGQTPPAVVVVPPPAPAPVVPPPVLQKLDYPGSIAAAQQAMTAGDYDTAIVRATDALNERPGDAVAKDLLSRAQVRKALQGPQQAKAVVPPPAQTVPQPPPAPIPQPLPGPLPAMPKIQVTKHEVSVSGDFTLGSGKVTLPVGFSLIESLGGGVEPKVFAADRDSQYYGGTISYSYGQKWYLDLSYAKGTSSGQVDVPLGAGLGDLPSDFSIKDTWYQAYVRYKFRSFFGVRNMDAYLRVGATYIDATLEVSSPPAGVSVEQIYSQRDTTTEIQGNLGFGLMYWLHRARHLRYGLQLEGEGFFGHRSQSSLEHFEGTTLPAKTADLSNTLYGGIIRATARIECPLGQSGLFKIFADGGFQGRFAQISYPGAGSESELLSGPYIKLGARYSF
jgi:tetratricopeptide (TPR) repeat protein